MTSHAAALTCRSGESPVRIVIWAAFGPAFGSAAQIER